MAVHWTYDAVDPDPEADLCQGDIILKSAELDRVLYDVLPYFCDDRYTGFLVATQACDTVRRGKKPCKAKYITLAVIRELQPLLPEILQEVCGAGVDGVYKIERRWLAEQKLTSIINQNDPNFFYLHDDADVKIVSSIAMLRVTFSLRRQHYEVLTRARSGRLKSEYASKLGWLSGNLFSRVATPDWDDQESDPTASRKQVKKILALATKPGGENWIPEEWLLAAKKNDVAIDSVAPEKFRSEIEQFAPLEPLIAIIDRVNILCRDVLVDRDLPRTLRQSSEFLPAFSRSCADASNEITSAKRTEIARNIEKDEMLRDVVFRQIATLTRKKFKSSFPNTVDDICLDLVARKGLTKEAIKRIESVASAILSKEELLLFMAGIKALNVFNDEVIKSVRVAIEIVEKELAEIGKKLSTRLKNDRQTKTAIRSGSKGQF